jgi:starch phosphorylase
VGSHSTNGVAAIHSRLLRTVTVKDRPSCSPERQQQDQRHAAALAAAGQPALAGCIIGAIGD